jgi:hypothetical protein
MGFRYFKKGDGLSMNVMIVAILCIVVLVVLVIIFVNGTNKAQKNIDSCLGGSICVDNDNSCVNEKGEKGITIASDCIMKSGGKGKFCCAIVGGS